MSERLEDMIGGLSNVTENDVANAEQDAKDETRKRCIEKETSMQRNSRGTQPGYRLLRDWWQERIAGSVNDWPHRPRDAEACLSVFCDMQCATRQPRSSVLPLTPRRSLV